MQTAELPRGKLDKAGQGKYQFWGEGEGLKCSNAKSDWNFPWTNFDLKFEHLQPPSEFELLMDHFGFGYLKTNSPLVTDEETKLVVGRLPSRFSFQCMSTPKNNSRNLT